MPCGYEILDPITPQYISDLISWGAIGAEQQKAKFIAKLYQGYSSRFKNSTSGNIEIAANAILSLIIIIVLWVLRIVEKQLFANQKIMIVTYIERRFSRNKL